MKETLIVKAQTENGEVHLCRNPVTGVWELAQLPEAKPEVKKVAKTKPSKPKMPVITMEQIADKANDDEEWRELLRFLNYIDECAKEVRFLDPALEQARTGRYEQRKPPKPDKKESPKPPTVKEKLDVLVKDILKRRVSPAKMVERTRWLAEESLNVR